MVPSPPPTPTPDVFSWNDATAFFCLLNKLRNIDPLPGSLGPNPTREREQLRQQVLDDHGLVNLRRPNKGFLADLVLDPNPDLFPVLVLISSLYQKPSIHNSRALPCASSWKPNQFVFRPIPILHFYSLHSTRNHLDTMCGGSGCCSGPSNGALQAASPPGSMYAHPTAPHHESGADSCCASEASSGCGDDDESHEKEKPKPAAVGCQSSCCGGQTKEEANDSDANSHPSCDSGQDCCTPAPQETADPTPPDCCDGTTVPCRGCDDSCLDRLALRACEGEKKPSAEVRESFTESSSYSASLKSTECLGIEDDKPCGYHSRVTRDRYAATIEALGCICRALLAIGQESCCAPKKLSSIDRRRSLKRSISSGSVMSRRSADSCCAKSGSSSSHQHVRAPKSSCGKARTKAKGGCCGPKSSAKDFDARSNAESEASSCCGDGDAHSDDIGPVFDGQNFEADVEKGHAAYEHIILSVSGMTCTGCAKKLERTLAAVKQVRNAKTTMVLSRAEFDLDHRYGNLEDVMRHLERTSEFKCEVVKEEAFSFDAIVANASSFSEKPYPSGVKDVTVLDKKTVHISYDPAVMGARRLLQEGWGAPLELGPPRQDQSQAADRKHLRNMLFKTILSILLTIPVLVMAWASLPENEIAYGGASLALATIVQVVIAGEFYFKALKSLIFSRMVEMDLLIVLSTSAAYIYSVVSYGYLVAGDPLPGGQFFETSTMLVTLIMVGRFFAAWARHKAVESISIRSLQASTATIVDRMTGATEEIDTRLLQYGDIFKVAPDSTIPTDGTVLEGSSEVNESMITGESQPVEKRVKSAVIAGTINGSGTILVRVSRLPGNNTISAIAELVDKAKAGQPKIQELADKVASYFVPAILTLTLITFAAWLGTGVKTGTGVDGEDKSISGAAIQALTYAITVLIVSCPCAIGLAVPMVVVIGTGVAAKHGVIFKESSTIETAYKTSHVVFDKTGTLTDGNLSVASEQYADTDIAAPLLLGLLNDIKHPVSVAVATHLKSKGISATSVTDVKALPGKGVEGRTASGQVLRAGNSRWLGLGSNEQVQQILEESLTAFCFTIDNNVTAVIGLRDNIRPDAHSTVQELQRRGIAVHLVSGDDDTVVRARATDLNIPDLNVRSRCSPEDKQKYIQALLEQKMPTTSWLKKTPKPPVVIFCGDGTNDAVALAQATIGVAIQHADENQGIGADVAKSAAKIILATPRVGGILTLINVSKKSVTRIWLNFAWSFIYNIFAILLGGGAFVSLGDIRIPPAFAGLGEIVSVLPVIVFAVALRWSKV